MHSEAVNETNETVNPKYAFLLIVMAQDSSL